MARAGGDMKLHEYQAKEMLAKYGVPVNEGHVAYTPDEAVEIARRIGRPVMIKAQVMMGGRGKAGGVKYSKDADAARKNAEDILGKLLQNEQNPKGEVVKRVLVADAADIKKEYYLGATVDRASRLIIVMGSAEGGVAIEDVAKTNPDAIIKIYVDPRMGLLDYQARELAFGMGLGEHMRDLGKIARGLVQTLVDHDASLVEINPLAITGDGKLVALDAKMAIDDNALYKQKWAEEMRDPAEEEDSERQAREAGISFVKLDGNIGCMVNGAGLAMATMDTIKEYGGTPANFLDIGGGAREDKVEAALRIILSDPNVKAVMFNIFGGITRGDVVAKGIVKVLDAMKPDVPMVVRLVGTNAEEGRKILEEANLPAAATLDEAAQMAVKLANERK
ncbi:MAG TPA: ADP-forming succinate--CoA ligase subunit beta [Chloroflexia bacterium]|nr:ADP-forming succinate--CoA ligase subunit beta [Chloroflexia bacterium]